MFCASVSVASNKNAVVIDCAGGWWIIYAGTPVLVGMELNMIGEIFYGKGNTQSEESKIVSHWHSMLWMTNAWPLVNPKG